MARKTRGNRDGITISNLWKERSRQHGAHWRYRVWDPLARCYSSDVFEDDPECEEDKDRRVPGCAAGDKWAADQKARFQLGQATARRADLATISKAYLDELKESRAHKTTQRNVALAVAALTEVGAIDLSAKDFRAKVARWLSNLKASRAKAETGEAAASTRLRYLTHVRALVNYARVRGLLIGDPLHKLKVLEKVPETHREVFKLDELRRLRALEQRDNPHWLWVMLMVYTGLRREEALAARWEDIDWNARVLRVEKGKGRAGGKRRTVYLMNEAYELLSEVGGPDAKASRVGCIIPSKHKSGVTWAQFRGLLRKAKIEPDRGIDAITKMPRRLSPHACRHTFAALYLATGGDSVDLRRMLGHSADDLTEYYSQQVDLFRRLVQAEEWKPGQFRLTVAGTGFKRARSR